MRLSKKDRIWLRRFHKVTSGRASIAECNEFGISEERRNEFYNARYAKRHDAMKKRSLYGGPLSYGVGQNPMNERMDELVDGIDRKRKR